VKKVQVNLLQPREVILPITLVVFLGHWVLFDVISKARVPLAWAYTALIFLYLHRRTLYQGLHPLVFLPQALPLKLQSFFKVAYFGEERSFFLGELFLASFKLLLDPKDLLEVLLTKLLNNLLYGLLLLSEQLLLDVLSLLFKLLREVLLELHLLLFQGFRMLSSKLLKVILTPLSCLLYLQLAVHFHFSDLMQILIHLNFMSAV